ncbi:proline-rich proteoglycan 2-like [Grammomys surdaster]|uniref:proline-rich proteoglycan 2-like n=1 Tax=Grammomys surdaster TaxID=491861 RepID=UPI00109FB300|nr:proline-rich proteoglycan 2-like [Grammomys surdaster]
MEQGGSRWAPIGRARRGCPIVLGPIKAGAATLTPNLAKLATSLWEQGEVLEKQQAYELERKPPSGQGAGLPELGGPAGHPRAQGGEQRARDAEATADDRPTAPGSSSAPAAGLGGPDPRAGPACRRRPAPPPTLTAGSYPGSPYQTAPVQLQAGRGQSLARPRPSSSQETAGRAGRARQAAQEKPCLVPPLPPRGPGDKEARGSPERRQPARVPTPARGSSDPAVQSQVRAELPAAAGRGRVHRQPGGGRRRVGRAPGGEAGEGRAGGGGANASRPPCPRPPGALRRPARRTGRRRGRRAPSAVGYRCPQPGLPAPESPRCQSARAASSWFAHAPPVSPSAGHSGVLRNGGHRPRGARRSGHPPPLEL